MTRVSVAILTATHLYLTLNSMIFEFTLDNTMKVRATNGIGNKVKKVEVLTFTDEDLFWSLGLLVSHSSQALLDTIVFKLGTTCSLCV